MAGNDTEQPEIMEISSYNDPNNPTLNGLGFWLRKIALGILISSMILSVGVLATFVGMFLFPAAGITAIIIMAAVGIALGFAAVASIWMMQGFFNKDQGTDFWKRSLATLSTLLGGAGFGALFGFVIGTMLFPVIGSIAGASIGAFVGATSAFFVSGLLNMINNAPKVGIFLSFSGAVGLGTMAGAIAGTFLFPGLGTLVGAGIGAAAVGSLGVIIALGVGLFWVCKQTCQQIEKPSLVTDEYQANNVVPTSRETKSEKKYHRRGCCFFGSKEPFKGEDNNILDTGANTPILGFSSDSDSD